MKKSIFIVFLAACIFCFALFLASCDDDNVTFTNDTTAATDPVDTTAKPETTDTAETTGEVTDTVDTTSADTEEAEQGITYYADIDIADYGVITVELDPSQAPITVENFINLAESGFYDGLTFHRIMEDFMMQGCDPKGNGTGGSDQTIKGEFKKNGVNNTLSHTRGAISMARSSNYDSASSQFFIVHEDSTFLDGQYAAFGYVVEGMDVVDAVCESANPTDGNGTIKASEQPVITSITIRTVVEGEDTVAAEGTADTAETAEMQESGDAVDSADTIANAETAE